VNMVIKAFKHFFIPHKHNDYKPHLFREASILTIAIIAIVLISISAGTIVYINKTNMTATVLPAVLVDLTNNARVSNQRLALTRNTTLDQAAQLKAEDMARLGYFAHTSPQGITPWHWFDQAGYSFTYAGENLAINFSESVDVENAWLNSPSHKANILSSQFTEIGIATIDGIYQGYPTTYVVQMFGKPAKTLITEPQKAITTVTTVEKKAVKPTTETPVQVAVLPTEVKGETVVTEPKLETIAETEEFIAVKNNTSEEQVEGSSTSGTVHYSTWKDRLIFLTPSYTDRIYRIFIWIVLVALLLMSIFEVSRRHRKNIVYGILILVIMICLVYINKTMFVSSLLV